MRAKDTASNRAYIKGNNLYVNYVKYTLKKLETEENIKTPKPNSEPSRSISSSSIPRELHHSEQQPYKKLQNLKSKNTTKNDTTEGNTRGKLRSYVWTSTDKTK